MVVIPAGLAFAVLFWSGGPSWMMWTIGGSLVASWLVTKAMLMSKHDLHESREAYNPIHRYWSMATDVVIWTHWLICLAGVVIGARHGMSAG